MFLSQHPKVRKIILEQAEALEEVCESQARTAVFAPDILLMENRH